MKLGGVAPENEFESLIFSEDDLIAALVKEYRAEGDHGHLVGCTNILLNEYCRRHNSLCILRESVDIRSNYEDFQYIITRVGEVIEKETERIQRILLATGIQGLKAGASITIAAWGTLVAGGLKAAAITTTGAAAAAGLSGTSLAAPAGVIACLGIDIVCAGGALTIAGIVLSHWVSRYKVEPRPVSKL